jgi:hypothetical protein
MSKNYLSELGRLFYEHRVLDMPAIQGLILNRSRCSLFRDLQKLEYISSYNKAGRYYTLKAIPQFDETGLWKYEGVYFSRHGSLKNTVKHLVGASVAGYTHLELQRILGTRVQNTLFDLASIKEISRELYNSMYVYANIDTIIKASQMTRRRSILNKPPFDPYLAIEVLRAAIKYPEHSIAEIQAHLVINGVRISTRQIEDVFGFYNLAKKNCR